MALLTNIATALFLGITHMVIQSIGFVLSAWIISLALFLCAVIANIYLYRFHSLSFLALRRFAKQIVEKFPEAKIKKIILRKYNSPYSKYLGGHIPTKYHVILILDSPLSPEGESLQSVAINFHGVDGENIDGIGLKNDFCEAYKQPPKHGFLKEWNFTVTVNRKYSLEGHYGKKWTLYIRNFS